MSYCPRHHFSGRSWSLSLRKPHRSTTKERWRTHLACGQSASHSTDREGSVPCASHRQNLPRPSRRPLLHILRLADGISTNLLSRRGQAQTAFITHTGLFLFNFMPRCLCNATGTLQRLMDHIYREHIGKDVATYLDDLLMYAFQFPHLLPVFDLTLGQLIEA